MSVNFFSIQENFLLLDCHWSSKCYLFASQSKCLLALLLCEYHKIYIFRALPFFIVNFLYEEKYNYTY